MSQRLRELKNLIEKFRNKVENLKPSDNLSQSQDEVEEIDGDITNIEETIKEIEDEAEEDEELSTQKPLMDRFTEYKNDFDIIKNKYNKKRDEVMTAHNQELLMQGKLHGVEKKKAERDMALDEMKEIDEHDIMIDDIAKNIKDANNNLDNMNVEAKKQREQIERVDDKVIQMDRTVKKTGDIFDGMEKRVFCRKFMLWLGIVILLLANIVIAFLILAKGFGWPPFRENTENTENTVDYKSGIDYVGSNDIDLSEYLKKNYGFIMIKVGEKESAINNIANKIKDAKSKNINWGLYWTIKGSNDAEAKNEVQAAVNFGQNHQDLGKDFGFFFRFENKDFLKTNAVKINEYCGRITQFDCGISLGKDEYDAIYKANENLGNIKKYWIYPDITDTQYGSDNKVQVWSLSSTETFNGATYTKIKRK